MSTEQVKKLTFELRKAKRDAEYAQKSLARSQDLRQKLESEVTEQKNLIRKMEQKLARESQVTGLNKATRRILKLQEQATQDKHVIRAQDEEISRIQHELQVVTDALQVREEDLGLEEVERAEDSLLFMLSQARVNYDNAMLQLSHTEEELNAYKDKLTVAEQAGAQMNGDLSSALAERDDLSLDVQNMGRSMDQLSAKVTSLEEQLAALDEENAALSETNREMQAAADARDRDEAAVREDVDGRQAMYDELLQRYDRKASDLRDLHEKYEELQGERIADIELFASERDGLETILDQLRRELERVTGEAEAATGRVDLLEGQLAEARGTADSERRRADDEVDAVRRTQADADAAGVRAADLEAALAQARDDLAAQETAYRRMADAADQATTRLGALERQMNELREEKDALRAAKSQLQQTLLKEIRSLRSRAPGQGTSPARQSVHEMETRRSPVPTSSVTRAKSLDALRAMVEERRTHFQSPEAEDGGAGDILEFSGGRTLLDLAH